MSSGMEVKLEHPRDLLNLALAVILFVSPWIIGFTGETLATWTAWVTGLVIAVVSVSAMFVRSAKWEDVASLVVGIWAMAAPWLLGFATVTTALWAHVVVGALLAVLAAGEVWSDVSHKPAMT